ncbi:nucleoside triphosphatase YtkD [Staphylococcus gallinarum]|uniref:Nucleoside triphosphatase YtkD n=1 Tax=Staphylococcus gallinarum TaxID=1293 RepID=A0A3A0VN79_STAGA|nr:nucleoside triphosphatase YtkD [Staphylococcus gallinarum]RIP34003.1 nucleoside triphosphatase YtkD [Staphylococcus gallinarum]
MSVKFKDKENDNVYLTYKDDSDIPDGEHVLIIPSYQGKLLFTQHKVRGIEFPGGKVEPGETSLSAAQRELFEETGGVGEIYHYIAQYNVERTCGKSFTKDVFMVNVSDLEQQLDYHETNGPLCFNDVSEIPSDRMSFLLKDAAILQCLERVMEIGFYKS